MKRIISAIVFLPFFFLIINYGNPLVFFIFLSVFLLAGLFELYTLLNKNGKKSMTYPGMIFGWLVAFSFFSDDGQSIYFFMVAFVMVLLVLKLFSKQPLQDTVEETANTFFGVLYFALLLSYLIFLRKDDDGRQLIFMLFLITWFGDTFAYYIGSAVGKHPLAPTISPKKSIEGTIGGLLGSVIASLIAHYWFFPSVSVLNAVILGLAAGAAGQVGDLCESMLKRNLKVKDSGFLVPGHGGLLDRLDSILFSAPVFYYLYIYIS